VFWQLYWFGAPATQYRPCGFLFSCENDFGTKVTLEVGVKWYFDRKIQIPFLRAKWLSFEGL